jgi:hypothetical protein
MLDMPGRAASGVPGLDDILSGGFETHRLVCGMGILIALICCTLHA